jgi:hypothetical protein
VDAVDHPARGIEVVVGEQPRQLLEPVPARDGIVVDEGGDLSRAASRPTLRDWLRFAAGQRSTSTRPA